MSRLWAQKRAQQRLETHLCEDIVEIDVGSFFKNDALRVSPTLSRAFPLAGPDFVLCQFRCLVDFVETLRVDHALNVSLKELIYLDTDESNPDNASKVGAIPC